MRACSNAFARSIYKAAKEDALFLVRLKGAVDPDALATHLGPDEKLPVVRCVFGLGHMLRIPGS